MKSPMRDACFLLRILWLSLCLGHTSCRQQNAISPGACCLDISRNIVRDPTPDADLNPWVSVQPRYPTGCISATVADVENQKTNFYLTHDAGETWSHDPEYQAIYYSHMPMTRQAISEWFPNPYDSTVIALCINNAIG